MKFLVDIFGDAMVGDVKKAPILACLRDGRDGGREKGL